MARSSLSGSRKTTAKAVAEKIAGKGSTKATSASTVADKIPVASSPIVNSSSTGFSTVVPGLIGINPDGIAAMMPQFQENSYAITDPLNPPESLPQVSEAQFDKGWDIIKALNAPLS
jgi:hypothetical protein